VTVVDLAAEFGVTELLHYTPNPGMLGTLRTECLLSRRRVEGNEEVAYIREPVWPRKKERWTDHVSLSISRINAELFEQSRRHYPEHWWSILSFDTAMLDVEDVWFATCNNFFPRCQRNQDEAGFRALFAEEVVGKLDTLHRRDDTMPASWPTDRTAEVLYPGQIGLSHLRSIYVSELKHRAIILAWSEALSIEPPMVLIEPQRFE
jgi:ssDNA thymidine ADP-ribosyltransferase, DarT